MHRRFTALVVLCSLLAPLAATAQSAPAPLDYRAYDGWNAIRSVVLADDGSAIAYSLVPEDGDATLVARTIASGRETREARGLTPQFTADGKFLVYTIAPLKTDLDASKKAKQKPEEAPKNGLGVLDLASGTALQFERIKDVKVAKHGGRSIAFLAEPKKSAPAKNDAPSPAPSSAANPAASAEPNPAASASASPAPSPSPTPDAKKKDDGTELTIRDLQTGTNVIVPNVSDFAISADDRYVAYATQSKDGKADGIHVRELDSGTVRDLAVGPGHFTNVTFSPEGAQLAYLSDAGTFASDAPRYALFALDAAAAATPAKLVDATTAGLPATLAPSANGTLAFTKDGKKLFLGTAAVPTPQPMNTPEPMGVDLWSYRDSQLQSVQKHDADIIAKRTLRGVVDLASGRYVQLASGVMRTVIASDEPGAYAVGIDSRAYDLAGSWAPNRRDDYLVSLVDGSRRLAFRGVGNDDQLAPAGGYLVAYDEIKRVWGIVRARDGHRTTIAAPSGAHWYDELDDHPSPPPPYGIGGWLAGDRGVLLYDRYDIWLADPDSGALKNLTAGIGRKNKIVFRAVQPDKKRTSFAPGPIVLRAVDDRNKDSGLYTADIGGTSAPKRIVMQARAVGEPLKAAAADVYAFTWQSFVDSPNLYVSDAHFAGAKKISDANPQQANYRWGSAHLIHYKSTLGKPMDGVVLVPAGYDKHKTYPLLVYFYERFSDTLNAYHPPAPGTSPNFMRYVSNGYIVLLPDVAYEVGHPGRSALHCILPAIDATEKAYAIDDTRVGIAGHSWAAYQINYMITKTHRFRAVEAGAAVANMTSAYGGIRLESGVVREGQYEYGQSRIGATPWDRPDLYLENSGLFHIKDVTTPYLTIHNDADDAVPWSQGVEYFTAMRRLHKEAYMFTFNGEVHNLRGREAQKYWTVHMDEWFDHYLKGAPTPAWMTDGVTYPDHGKRSIRALFGEKER